MSNLRKCHVALSILGVKGHNIIAGMCVTSSAQCFRCPHKFCIVLILVTGEQISVSLVFYKPQRCSFIPLGGSGRLSLGVEAAWRGATPSQKVLEATLEDWCVWDAPGGDCGLRRVLGLPPSYLSTSHPQL